MKGKVAWKALISEQAKSGKTVSAFCRERGIADNRFFYWRKRVAEPEAVGKFVQIGAPKLIELELESGIKLRCTVEELKAVMNVLRA